MRAFVLAVSFACLLAIASNMGVMDYSSSPVAEAQVDARWIIVSKRVLERAITSDWEFVYFDPGVSSTFFIDKAGGATSFTVATGWAWAVVSEKSKSGYIVSLVCGRLTNGVKAISTQLTGNAVTLDVGGIWGFTYFVDFFNSHTGTYVGGVVQPMNGVPILILISLLGTVVAAEILTAKRR